MPQRGHELKLVRVYQDILSGGKDRRPGLQDALTQLDKYGKKTTPAPDSPRMKGVVDDDEELTVIAQLKACSANGARCLLGEATGHRVKGSRDRPRKTKTEAPAAVGRRAPVAVRDPRVVRLAAEGAPPKHAVHALFGTRRI